MPRLKGVSKKDTTGTIAKYYEALFGDKDPIEEPGTATGTPGNWWTIFARVPYIFEHATNHFGMFGMFSDKSVSQLDPKTRELGILRAGFTKAVSLYFHSTVRLLENLG